MMRYVLIGSSVLALLLGVQTFRVERLKADARQDAKVIAELQQARSQAIQDAQTQQEQCAARVAEARRSSQAINDLIEAPHETDANGCPVRNTLSADSLRDALQRPAQPVRQR